VELCGGVINLISRKPGDSFKGETLINLTTEAGQDITTYLESPLNEQFKISITAGIHNQNERDFDKDGWIDMAGYERITMRPRLFWENSQGTNVYATVGYMTEDRTGGTRSGFVAPDNSPFHIKQDSQRIDAAFILNIPLDGDMNFNTRSSITRQEHNHLYGLIDEDDKHNSYLLESTLTGYTSKIDWLIGAAFISDSFESASYPAFNYEFEVPALFSQFDYDINDYFSTSLSARYDDHSEYGEQFSPRLSLLYKSDDFTIRGSYGRGFFAPTPFIEDIDAAGLSSLEPLNNIAMEEAETASIDISYNINNLETGLTIFGSNVDAVTELEAFSTVENGTYDRVRLVNSVGTSQIRGSELLLRYYWEDYKVTLSYLYLDASRESLENTDRTPMPLTPKHSAGLVIMKESHGDYRLGFEAYYTGEQQLENNPYRSTSDSYWHLGLLGEITIGNVSWFVNAENLLNVRQTKEDPLVLPIRSPSGRWTTDIWSRNDGFIVNAGFRIKY